MPTTALGYCTQPHTCWTSYLLDSLTPPANASPCAVSRGCLLNDRFSIVDVCSRHPAQRCALHSSTPSELSLHTSWAPAPCRCWSPGFWQLRCRNLRCAAPPSCCPQQALLSGALQPPWTGLCCWCWLLRRFRPTCCPAKGQGCWRQPRSGACQQPAVAACPHCCLACLSATRTCGWRQPAAELAQPPCQHCLRLRHLSSRTCACGARHGCEASSLTAGPGAQLSRPCCALQGTGVMQRGR